jgi:hypothetical protein
VAIGLATSVWLLLKREHDRNFALRVDLHDEYSLCRLDSALTLVRALNNSASAIGATGSGDRSAVRIDQGAPDWLNCRSTTEGGIPTGSSSPSLSALATTRT